MATVPEIHSTISALYSQIAACYRDLAVAASREAHALSDAMQITTSEAGLVAAHDVAALRTEIIARIDRLERKRDQRDGAVNDAFAAIYAKLDLLVKERTE